MPAKFPVSISVPPRRAALLEKAANWEVAILTSREAFAIAFGQDATPDDMLRLQHFGIPDSGPPLSQLRAVVSAFESYKYPTTLNIRCSPEDLVTVQCDGFRFIADRFDFAIGHTVITQGGFESHVTNAIRHFLRPGMTGVDIGANVGFQTMQMAHVVGGDGKVIAIEPSTENCRLIMMNAAANHFGHVEVQPFALSDKPGVALLSPAIGSNGVIFAQTEVANPNCAVAPRSTLDDVLRGRRVDFIKIDVEGSEFRVMRGAKETLGRHRPAIVSEFRVPDWGSVNPSPLGDRDATLRSCKTRSLEATRSGTASITLCGSRNIVSLYLGAT